MTARTEFPGEEVDLRKYAAISLALGLARGALIDALAGNFETTQRIVNLTSLAAIAETLNCTENDLAVSWDEHLTLSELDQLKGF
jgi:hypothetical protein